jgi:hypothetical protein
VPTTTLTVCAPRSLDRPALRLAKPPDRVVVLEDHDRRDTATSPVVDALLPTRLIVHAKEAAERASAASLLYEF